jgi:hypothetical protein
MYSNMAAMTSHATQEYSPFYFLKESLAEPILHILIHRLCLGLWGPNTTRKVKTWKCEKIVILLVCVLFVVYFYLFIRLFSFFIFPSLCLLSYKDISIQINKELPLRYRCCMMHALYWSGFLINGKHLDNSLSPLSEKWEATLIL